ncbi:acid phosphatase [Tenacibaculum adriaticum]|uniref:Acid phosphatase n=1 Tax=Tenacibaculum adriaticum TaxID=413713 RepID=A0A5S5DVW4_9FLAO|nr:5'-nucleotidase, lipoprotein e(P4) family [Tenacibaculum adriaticum]TYQ00078.1 acid phosphatase [Tenacibaculum adriaticum]
MKNRIALLLLILTIGCKSTSIQSNDSISKSQKGDVLNKEYSILAVLWQQNSAEYKALTYQAFNTAQLQLDNMLRNKKGSEKPMAIVTDIDETLLDNSPYNAKMIELNEDYSEARWIEWGKERKAKAIPGALEFFKYAKSRGVEIFYISNRLSKQKRETIENMQKLGFPFSDDQHVLLKTDTSKKESRRFQVEKTHEIIMLLGDNLSDFHFVFDDQPSETRSRKVDSLKTFFGNKFIVLPNPMYGDWETDGILEGNYKWTPYQKDSIRRSKIRSY